ncbi:hypothetical protein [Streptomyces inhibens]|uniref:hypothetical protein n=1 Tax=Streptomyces inhibens TaxID=2293571 RepID=UPI001EE69BE5|nr:hypothetical protein [Streptomyces inhibens]UKY54169.1 hypothetical protein KI385_38770 [Streptomyces inhibens]
MGITTALLFGGVVTAAGTAAAATTASKVRTSGTGEWHWAGKYKTFTECKAAGKTSDVPWDCKRYYGNSPYHWDLYLFEKY